MSKKGIERPLPRGMWLAQAVESQRCRCSCCCDSSKKTVPSSTTLFSTQFMKCSIVHKVQV